MCVGTMVAASRRRRAKKGPKAACWRGWVDAVLLYVTTFVQLRRCGATVLSYSVLAEIDVKKKTTPRSPKRGRPAASRLFWGSWAWFFVFVFKNSRNPAKLQKNRANSASTQHDRKIDMFNEARKNNLSSTKMPRALRARQAFCCRAFSCYFR